MDPPLLKNRRPTLWTVVVAAGLAAGAPRVLADRHVAINATADPAYLRHKFSGAEPVAESYVFMQGQYFDGVRRDHSIERMKFRQIAENLAPELARARYFPTQDPQAADLLLVVHWGTTKPRFTAEVQTGYPAAGGSPDAVKGSLEIAASIMNGENDILGAATSIPDGSNGPNVTRFDEAVKFSNTINDNLSAWTNAQLLGYTKDLRRFSETAATSTKEFSLRASLEEERYFVIVRAYDLHGKAAPRSRAVWSLYMNIRAPGNNFLGALGLMGVAASEYFGHESNGVQTIQSHPRTGSVNLAPLVIMGEAK